MSCCACFPSMSLELAGPDHAHFWMLADARGAELGVGKYSITASTLEEVFVRLATDDAIGVAVPPANKEQGRYRDRDTGAGLGDIELTGLSNEGKRDEDSGTAPPSTTARPLKSGRLVITEAGVECAELLCPAIPAMDAIPRDVEGCNFGSCADVWSHAALVFWRSRRAAFRDLRALSMQTIVPLFSMLLGTPPVSELLTSVPTLVTGSRSCGGACVRLQASCCGITCHPRALRCHTR